MAVRVYGNVQATDTFDRFSVNDFSSDDVAQSRSPTTALRRGDDQQPALDRCCAIVVGASAAIVREPANQISLFLCSCGRHGSWRAFSPERQASPVTAHLPNPRADIIAIVSSNIVVIVLGLLFNCDDPRPSTLVGLPSSVASASGSSKSLHVVHHLHNHRRDCAIA